MSTFAHIGNGKLVKGPSGKLAADCQCCGPCPYIDSSVDFVITDFDAGDFDDCGAGSFASGATAWDGTFYYNTDYSDYNVAFADPCVWLPAFAGLSDLSFQGEALSIVADPPPPTGRVIGTGIYYHPGNARWEMRISKQQFSLEFLVPVWSGYKTNADQSHPLAGDGVFVLADIFPGAAAPCSSIPSSLVIEALP